MNLLSVFSWNVRGLASSVHIGNVKNFIQKEKPCLVCIQETKCGPFSDIMKKSMGVYDNSSWAEVPSVGLSGGLVIFWDPSFLNIDVVRHQRYWLWISGNLLSTWAKISIINIYAPQNPHEKASLWKNLSLLLEEISEEFLCITEDFNCVRMADERRNCLYRDLDSVEFNDFIIHNNLFDAKFINSPFTWYGRDGKCSKLDMVLLNRNWFDSGDWLLKALDRKNSDHRAILLSSKSTNWGPKPFKVFNCWLEDKSLMQTLGEVWCKGNSLNVQQRFKALKNFLKVWNKTINGNVEEKINLLKSK